MVRNDASNGIWLCANCAALVDERRGSEFPPFVLEAWKKLSETRRALDQGSPATRYGWLDSLTVVAPGAFLPVGTIDFGPATVIVGPNGSGKTQLLKLLGASQAKDFAAWAAHGGIDCELRWFDPHLQVMQITVRDHQPPLFHLGECHFPTRPSTPTIISLQEVQGRDAARRAISSLGLSSEDLPGLVPFLGRRGGAGFEGSLVDVVELDDEEVFRVHVTRAGPARLFSPSIRGRL